MAAAAESDWDAALEAWDALEAQCDGDVQASAVHGAAPATTATAKLAPGSSPGQKRVCAVALDGAARRKVRACGVTRTRERRVYASESARLLATGPRLGCELRGTDGVPLRTVANLGLAKGALAELEVGGGTGATCCGFAVRALEPAVPLLSHQTVGRALAELTAGGDLHRANAILHHDDVTTVRVMVALWFAEFKLPIPSAFAADADKRRELSAHAQRRLKQRRGNPLGFRFMIESCGYDTSTREPLVPPTWIGRQFNRGEELHAALSEIADPGADVPLVATYGRLRVVEDASWMDIGALQRCVTARQVSPLAVVRLHYNAHCGDVEVTFEKYGATALDRPEGSASDTLARVVTGCVLKSTVSAAVVLQVPVVLLPHLTSPAAKTATASLPSQAECSSTAPSTAASAARSLLDPAARLQTFIRRGRGLCTADNVRKAAEELVQAGSCPVAELGYALTSGTRVLLWRLLGCVFQDVCPYNSCSDCPALPYCSIQALVGLAAVAHADHQFRLPEKLAERVITTAIWLHAFDGPGCVWPWRGWARLEDSADPGAFEFGNSNDVKLRDAIRAAMATLPMGSGDKAVLLRHLGALTADSQWSLKLRPLRDPVSVAGPVYSVAEGGVLDAEACLASFDHITSPNILLFVQGCLPWVPREESQHSLSALADLIWRLSSSVNVRAVRQRNSGISCDDELLRITSFVHKQDPTEKEEAAKRLALQKYDPMGAQPDQSATISWLSAFETMHLTPHEKLMAKVIVSVQRHLQSATTKKHGTHPVISCGVAESVSAPRNLAIFKSPSSPGITGGRGRPPTKFESRTAFLQLFGIRHDVSVLGDSGQQVVSVTVAGTPDVPVLVQKLDADGSSRDVKQTDATGLYARAVDALVAYYEAGRTVRLPACCPGFAWACKSHAVIQIRFATTGSPPTLAFIVDRQAIPLFDASQLMISANAPVVIDISKRPRVRHLLGQILYCTDISSEFSDDPMSLLTTVEAEAVALLTSGDSQVVDWFELGATLPQALWRDLFVKIQCREHGVVTISSVARDGRRTCNAVQPMTEGTMLRVLIGLQLVYPKMLRRKGDLRFKINADGSENAAAFTHLVRTVSLLAFGSIDNGVFDSTKPSDSLRALPASPAPVPHVSTVLWPHQAEACRKTLQGILDGKRGFADASAVGAGKSLSSLAIMCQIASLAAAKGVPRHGFLVLVPTTALIREWEIQAHLHTTGLNVLIQASNGALVSRGRSSGGSIGVSKTLSKAGQIDACTVVITTLARARDKPFHAHPGWDLVVIDECLSVQNDTAVQTMEAWRQVAASRFGVLMLSATFFRSSFKRLFYMIRMLRSALPRTEPYLAALLREHITVFVPENRRSWSLLFQPVPLGASLINYQQLLADSSTASREHRSLWSELRSFLRKHYEKTTLINAFASEATRLQQLGRRPVLFANSDAEAARIMAAVPGAHGLNDVDKLGPLVLTVNRHSHGLNLQDRCDAVISRPQPGDIIEQMKGRIDRPGQPKKNLILVVLFASETIEEAEAANIRLCGAFFRQWLDPLSKTFQEKALSASIAAVRQRSEAGARQERPVGPAVVSTAPTVTRQKVSGAVAAAFQMQLRDIGSSSVESEQCDTAGHVATAGVPGCVGGASMAGQDLTPDASEKKRLRQLTKMTSPVSLRKITKQQTPACARKTREHGQQQATTSVISGQKQGAKLSRVVVPDSDDLARRQPIRCMCGTTITDAVKHLQQQDTRLAGVIAAIGHPTGLLDQIGSATDCFRSLAKSIVYQQLSVKVAAVIFQRLVDLCGGDELLTPAKALTLSDDDLRHKCGFSYRKAGYLKHLAGSFVSGELSDVGLSKMTDDEAMAAVTKVKGLGEWSVHMFLMFSLGRQDIFPRGDLAIRKAMKRLYGIADVEGHQTAVKELPPMEACSALAEAWAPYRTVASWYMWHVVETKEAAYTFGA